MFRSKKIDKPTKELTPYLRRVKEVTEFQDEQSLSTHHDSAYNKLDYQRKKFVDEYVRTGEEGKYNATHAYMRAYGLPMDDLSYDNPNVVKARVNASILIKTVHNVGLAIDEQIQTINGRFSKSVAERELEREREKAIRSSDRIRTIELRCKLNNLLSDSPVNNNLILNDNSELMEVIHSRLLEKSIQK